MITFNPLKSISLNNNHLNSRSIIFSFILSLIISTIMFPASNNNPRVNNQKDFLFSSPSEWIVCGPTSWEDLKTYLPQAKMSGVTIKVILLPPFQSTNICTEGSYSEPFQNNYIRWAQEIAKLSLRYSNIVQYEIYQLRENLNLGYLRQTYIDSMITAGKTLNPKLQFNLPYRKFYIDRDATGTGTGESWVNAATSIARLNWTTLGNSQNDTVYISGGADSTTYPPDSLNNKGTRKYQVVFTRGKDAGHNGEVYFVNPATGNWKTKNLLIYNTSNVKITGMKFYSFAPLVQVGDNAFANISIASHDVVIDNCYIWSNGMCVGVYNGMWDRTTINNCFIEVPTNSTLNDQDCINFFGGNGGHTITNNTLIMRGLMGSLEGRHFDCVQFGARVGGQNLQTTIANNLMIFDAPGAYAANILILMGLRSNRFMIYNNIFYDNTARINSFVCAVHDDTTNISLRLLNNTFIQKSPNSFHLRFGNIDTLIMKNNIIISDYAKQQASLWFSTAIGNIAYRDIDYNSYHRTIGYTEYLTALDPGTTYYSFSEWQALGYDTHGQFDSTLFVNEGDSTVLGYKLRTGDNSIGAGTDISGSYPFLSTDILGTSRSNWNMGAVEGDSTFVNK